MHRFLAIVAAVLAASVSLASDMTVLSVDSNGVSNVGSVKFGTSVDMPTAYVRDIELGNATKVRSDGIVYITTNGNRTITMPWPVGYSYTYTNYPGVDNNYTDPFVTEWFLNRAVEGLRADLLVFGDKTFFERYTNSPPTNIESLLGYVSNCVYLLSNVEVQQSYNSVSNEIEALKTRVKRTELTADHFGAGVTDLDYIINSDMENMDASDMLNMIKTLAMYIKNGNTNEVTRSEEDDE